MCKTSAISANQCQSLCFVKHRKVKGWVTQNELVIVVHCESTALWLWFLWPCGYGCGYGYGCIVNWPCGRKGHLGGQFSSDIMLSWKGAAVLAFDQLTGFDAAGCSQMRTALLTLLLFIWEQQRLGATRTNNGKKTGGKINGTAQHAHMGRLAGLLCAIYILDVIF